MSEENGVLKIGAKAYNAVIEAGQSVSFGFTAHCESGQPKAPECITLTDEESRKKEEQPKETPDGKPGEKPGQQGQSAQFPEKWKGLNYALFTAAEGDLSLYTCRTNVNGDVHTNGNFFYQGTTLSVQGNLEAAEKIRLNTSSMENACLVSQKSEGADSVPMPDMNCGQR